MINPSAKSYEEMAGEAYEKILDIARELSLRLEKYGAKGKVGVSISVHIPREEQIGGVSLICEEELEV